MTAADRPPVPRAGDTITNPDQLDALPVGVVMRARNDLLTETGRLGADGMRVVWGEGWSDHAAAIEHLAPLTVLYVPGEQPCRHCGSCDGPPSCPDCDHADRPSVTDDARAEAERRWGDRRTSDRLPIDWLDEGMASGFVLGAQWAAGRAETTTALPGPGDGCQCTGHSQDAGGGHFEYLIEYEPACPEHSEHVWNPRTGMWEHSAETTTGKWAVDPDLPTANRPADTYDIVLADDRSHVLVDSLIYVDAAAVVEAHNRAETTTATVEDAARVLHGTYPEGTIDPDACTLCTEALEKAQALDATGLLARPLPGRDEIARALFLEQYPDSAGAWDGPEEYGKDAWRRRADAVMALLSGGESR